MLSCQHKIHDMNMTFGEGSLAQAIFDQARELNGALTSREMQAVWFHNEEAVGMIRLWENTIVEMDIPERCFWAHFDGNDAIVFYDHIHAFFEALYRNSPQDVQQVLDHAPMKLLIICTTGITSSLAAAHINELARQHGWNVEADWSTIEQARWKAALADVVLYAPQAAAAFQGLSQDEKRHCALIRPLDFATMNMPAIVRQAQLLMA